MATSVADRAKIAYLNFVTTELNRYIPLPLLVFGTFGNILNIIVFTRPLLRTNSCSLYFLGSSIVNFFALYIGLITPFLGLFNLDPTQSSIVLCKLRAYLRFTTITLSSWFILLACFDRFVSSSPRVAFRRLCSLRTARRIIFLAVIIAFLCPFTQIFYCYSIIQNDLCTFRDNICRLINDTVFVIFHSSLPPVIMVILSILTIRNVRRTRLTGHQRRRDLQLTRLLLAQVVILVILFATPVTAQKLYTSITMNTVKGPVRRAVESLISQISLEISYMNSSTAFYIYSLTNKSFRKEVVRVFSSLLVRCGIRSNAVQPVTTEFRLHRNQAIAVHVKQSIKPSVDNSAQ